MALETGAFVADLNLDNPTGTDPKSQGDDHIRLIKSVLKNSFAGFPGAVVVTGDEAQGASANDFVATVTPAPTTYASGMVVLFKATHANTGAATLKVNALGAKSLKDMDGGALAAGDIPAGGLVAAAYDGSHFLLLSGNDRAARSGDSYAGAHDFTGAVVTAATAAAGDNSTKIATTAYADAADALKAPLASPALTGTPTAPTAAGGTNTAQVATTAFVQAAAFNTALPGQAGNAGKFLTTDGANGLWATIVNDPIGVIIQDQRASGAAGAPILEASWQKAPFNTEVRDPGGLASISSDEFTLQPGTWEIHVRRNVVWRVGSINENSGPHTPGAQARLYNVTSAAVVAYGETAGAYASANGVSGEVAAGFGGTFELEIVHVVAITTATAFRVEAYCRSSVSVDYTWGQAISTGGPEVYGTIECRRVGN